MSVISTTKLYQFLRSKFEEDTAENVTTFIENKIKEEVENKTQILTTKEDLVNTKAGLTKDLADTKVNLIKWIFAFWITLVLMIIGLYLKK